LISSVCFQAEGKRREGGSATASLSLGLARSAGLLKARGGGCCSVLIHYAFPTILVCLGEEEGANTHKG